MISLCKYNIGEEIYREDNGEIIEEVESEEVLPVGEINTQD